MNINQETIQIEPPTTLLEKVLNRVRNEKEWQSIKTKFFSLIFVVTGQIWVFFLAWKNFQPQILQSEFWVYLKLLALDIKNISGLWREYSLTLLESLPATPLLILLSLTFTLLFSIKFLSKYSKISLMVWNIKRRAL
jgi:hypothetical protein